MNPSIGLIFWEESWYLASVEPAQTISIVLMTSESNENNGLLDRLISVISYNLGEEIHVIRVIKKPSVLPTSFNFELLFFVEKLLRVPQESICDHFKSIVVDDRNEFNIFVRNTIHRSLLSGILPYYYFKETED